jgi:hypothetical protein
MPSAVRIWEALRAEEAAKWKQANAREYFWAGKEKGAEMCAYQAALMGEAIQEADKGGNVGGAGTLQDMAKAYEEVDPERVWAEGRSTGFPGRLLAWILNVYTGPRMLMSNGVCTKQTIWPRRGAPAGSRFADTALRMVLLRPMDKMTANHPNANLSVYIDDVGTRCAGKKDDVIRWTVEHAIAVKEAITQAGLRVADDKGQVIAKDARWRNRIAIEAADSGVILKQCRTIKNLGIDFAFGVKSKEPTRALRLQKAAQRGKRLDTIKSAGIPAARFFKTSSEPVAMYGVGVNGINSGSLHKLRALASGANSRSTAGKNIGLDLLLADVDQYDPTFLAQTAPLTHWANQIWNASNSEGKAANSTQRRTKHTMRSLRRSHAKNRKRKRGRQG